MPRPFFIAEIGINANGSVEDAKKLIDMAASCGCNAVKFQKRDIDTVYTKELLDQPRESPWGTTQRSQKQGLEFDDNAYNVIDEYCRDKGIYWFASAWDLKSQEFLKKFNLPFNKIASAMITNVPLLEMVASEKKHTFISTAMCNFEDIDKAVKIFRKANCSYTLMHCVGTYPCADEDCNLLMIKTLKERYKCPVGYSSHSPGIFSIPLAVMLGAEAIEVHITLDRSSYGSDQSSSLEERGLELAIRDCVSIDKYLGRGLKDFSDKEKAVAKKLRYWL